MSKMVLEHEIRENLAQNLKIIRKRNKITQQVFADVLEIEQKCVGSWEENRARPPLQALVRISDEFEIDLKELLTKKLCV